MQGVLLFATLQLPSCKFWVNERQPGPVTKPIEQPSAHRPHASSHYFVTQPQYNGYLTNNRSFVIQLETASLLPLYFPSPHQQDFITSSTALVRSFSTSKAAVYLPPSSFCTLQIGIPLWMTYRLVSLEVPVLHLMPYLQRFCAIGQNIDYGLEAPEPGRLPRM